MNPQRKKAAQLFALARRAPAPKQTEVPPVPLGFATRVAAQWAGSQPLRSPGDLWERFCWCGAGVAVAVCVTTMTLRPAAEETNALDLLLQAPARGTSLFEL